MYIFSGLLIGFFASPTCPSNALEIRLGLRHGFKVATSVALGAVSGDLLVLIAVLVGLLSLLQTWPVLGIFLWFVGGLVLLHVARGSIIQAFNKSNLRANKADVASIQHDGEPIKAFWGGLVITISNPYTVLWWVGLIGPVLDTSVRLPLGFIVSIIAGSLIWFVSLAGLLQFARYQLGPMFWMTILLIAGLSVGGYGFYFLWRGLIGIYSLIV